MRMAENIQVTYLLQLAEVLDSHRKASNMTDIILVCEEKDFPAHKLILSAKSNYFRAMFASGWEENKSNKIKLPSVGAKEMEIILSFLYTGKCEDIGDQALLKAVLATSHFLQINTLFEHCYKIVCDTMSCKSFLEIYNLTFHYNDEGMTEHVLDFFTQHFEDVAASAEFLKLNTCHILKIFQHPDTLKSSMDVVMKALFRWTEVDEDREQTLLQILTTLDLKSMSTAFLSENLRGRALVKKNYHILTLLTAEATSRILTTSSKNIETTNEPKLLSFDEDDDRQVFRMYNIKQNRWSSPKSLPFNLNFRACASWFAGHIYFFGSSNIKGNIPSDQIIKYCPYTNTAISAGTLETQVTDSGAGVLGEYIYVVNGCRSDGEVFSIVQRYHPVTGTCDFSGLTNEKHFWPVVLPFHKCLLVVGSFDKSVERYDPECDTWTLITDIPGEIYCCSAAICKEKLFVVPNEKSPEFQIFDFDSATWEQKQFEGLSGKIRDLHSTTVEGKCILLIRDGKNVLHSFDPESNQWLRKSIPCDEPLNCVTCVV